MQPWPRNPIYARGTLFLAALLCLAPSVGAQEATPPPVEVAAEDGAASPLVERYNVDVSSDGIELTPIARDSAVDSIEILDGEEEALVNGKPFTRAELVAFLGADGKEIAALLALSDEARRARLGHRAEDEEGASAEAPEGVDVGHWSVPPAPRAPKAPRAPRAPHISIEADGDDRVSFGQSITIAAGESTGEAVCIGCSITVEGNVDGDVVAVGGRVELRPGAVVGGNAVSVGGRVDVASGAVVDGDAVAVGGRIHVEEGGVVEGQKSSVGWGASWFGGPTRGFMPFDFSGSFSDLFWTILRALLLALVAAIGVLFARGPVERTSRRLLDEPWKALFAGLLTQLLFFPVLVLVTVILAVSIIGIPLLVLVPVAVLAFVVSMLIGYISVAQSLGRWVRDRFGSKLSEPFAVVIAGVLLIQSISIAGRFVSLFGTVGGIIGFTILALGFFVKYVAWTVGLGGMVLSMMARDWRRPAPAGFVPPTPPIPPTPPSPPERELAPIDFTRDDEPARDEFAATETGIEEVTETVEEEELRARREEVEDRDRRPGPDSAG